MVELKYSLVIPVYKNEESVEDLVLAVKKLSEDLNNLMEVIFVIDGSPDQSYFKLKLELEKSQLKYTLAQHSRNFGSFPAIRSGLSLSTTNSIAVMAADLQEPITLIKDFFLALENNECDIVFGQRIGRNDPLTTKIFSSLFWGAYRRFIQKDIPVGGVDIFGCNKKVKETILQFEESHSSLLGILFWIGFRRKFVKYQRLERLKGKSAWSFSKKLAYLLDSCFSFSNLPVQALMYAGFFGVFFSIIASIVIILVKVFSGINVPGYTATAILILFFAGLNSFGLGLIGNYVWRAYENTKKRPLTIIQSVESSKE